MTYDFGILALIAIAGGIVYRFWLPLPDGPTDGVMDKQKGGSMQRSFGGFF